MENSLTPPDKAGSADVSSDSVLGSVRQKRSKKRLAELKSFSLEEPLHEDVGERGTLTRSKTYDPPSSLKSDQSSSVERRRSITTNLPKHNITFHRIFQDVTKEEELKDSFSCALQREVLYQGRLYISSNHLAFYCNMLRKEIKVLIPVNSVIVLKKANTALLVPNALSVRTVEGEKYLFGSLRNRELCYQAVHAVCSNLQDGSACSTPFSYSAEASFEQSKVLNSSHSDIDQNQQESDSTDICTTGTDVHFETQILVRSGSSEVDAVTLNPWIKGEAGQEKVNLDYTNHTQWVEPSAVNILLIVYMLLVLLLLVSSGYIGLRIMELENQLSIMGAWPKGEEIQGLQDS
ncbi:GRAM domain-containing protein 2B isoform X1 [Xenopus laevis]|uniref:GRAM domain-containing protein 2B isoform X1 n=1 Tax=Xenopus laevis TaxID=8355 RepID=A0A8J0U917_XENLA|nr:GRAM domain-containing protein 2B isoform X1 [Xenopus laevis]